MKSRFILFTVVILFCIPAVFLSEAFAQSRLAVKINFTEQETRELEKIKSSGITLRTLYSKLASTGNKKAPVRIEELFFNKQGLPIERKTYAAATQIVDERIEYKYNSKGHFIKEIVFNDKNKPVRTETIKVNKDGKALEIVTETVARGKTQKVKRVMSYNKQGFVSETKAYDEKNTLIVKEVDEYKNDLLLAKKKYAAGGQFLGSETYEYDSQKRKIKEIGLDIQYKKEKDSVSGKEAIVGYQRKSEYTFKYDDKGNICEIKAPEYKQVFTFNENGDCIRDVVFDKGGKRQNDNEFYYDENGLLEQIIRYYPDGSPGAYISYKFERSK